MSRKSNDQGRAYEYACIINLEERISEIRPCVLVENSSLDAARRSWETLSADDKKIYRISSLAAVEKIFQMEPRITENSADTLELSIQTDEHGKAGDVRDILIIRHSITWEIGLSLKHNHSAVKHSRLGAHLDFGNSWYGIPCSDKYWESIKPVFDYLKKEEEAGTKWSELPDKEGDVYIPLLQAFIDELNMQSQAHRQVPSLMVKYLLGRFDFYKIISIDREELTRIQGFNMHGTLNLPAAQNKAAEIAVPKIDLPDRIVLIELAPGKKNTVNLYMDHGWQFSFRIHNASTRVESSLKFDIQIVGMPATILTINALWR